MIRLTIVADELAAEILCGRLRTEGIECTYRKTDVAAGAGIYGGGFTIAGPTEVLVPAEQLEAARAILDAQ
jgi:uncharacterized protein (DUF1800 family)